MKRRNHLRLVQPFAAPRVVDKNGEVEVADDEFTRQLLTLNHGPRCAGWLARRFHDKLRRNGYFVARIEQRTEMPMWFALAIRLFEQRSSWSVDEHTRGGTRYFKVTWTKRGVFKRGSTIRVVH